ncbi:MAG TPA: hypothetical protein VIL55_11700 [Naasia sp.]
MNAVLAAGGGSGTAGGTLLVAILLVLILLSRLGGSTTTGRSVAVRGHAHGSGARQEVATHEAGHAAAAVGLGGRVRSATVANDGRSGLVRATLPDSRPETAIAFWRAGAIAAGTSRGASADDELIRQELRTVPSAERKQVRKAGERLAEQLVRQHRGRIERDARRLDERGRL